MSGGIGGNLKRGFKIFGIKVSVGVSGTLVKDFENDQAKCYEVISSEFVIFAGVEKRWVTPIDCRTLKRIGDTVPVVEYSLFSSRFSENGQGSIDLTSGLDGHNYSIEAGWIIEFD